MYWKYGIAIEQRGLTGAEKLNYASVVRMHLEWIESTDVGAVLLRAIAREVLNAAPASLVRFTETVKPGEPTHGVLIRPYLGGRCNAQQLNAQVWYTPYLQGACGHIWENIGANRGAYPHEILFHEMVHALRDSAGHGKSLTPLTGGLADYGDAEELFAIIAANIYMTDPTNRRSDKLGLRKSQELSNLEAPLADSFGFFRSSRDAFRLIEQFCTEDAWFTRRLAETGATFNPVAAFYSDRTLAQSHSNSAAARRRDGH